LTGAKADIPAFGDQERTDIDTMIRVIDRERAKRAQPRLMEVGS
jgi:hypothetical protein